MLNIYHDGNDWVVAESPEDAEKVYCEWAGSPCDKEEDNVWELTGLGESDLFTITHDCTPDEVTPEMLPVGATVKEATRGTDIVATTAAWIVHCGRGYLCGMDW